MLVSSIYGFYNVRFLSITDACRKIQNTLMTKLNLVTDVFTNPETNKVVTTKNKFNLLPDFQLSITEEFLQLEKGIKKSKHNQ